MKLNTQINGTFSETHSIVSAKQTHTPNHHKMAYPSCLPPRPRNGFRKKKSHSHNGLSWQSSTKLKWGLPVRQDQPPSWDQEEGMWCNYDQLAWTKKAGGGGTIRKGSVTAIGAFPIRNIYLRISKSFPGGLGQVGIGSRQYTTQKGHSFILSWYGAYQIHI